MEYLKTVLYIMGLKSPVIINTVDVIRHTNILGAYVSDSFDTASACEGMYSFENGAHIINISREYAKTQRDIDNITAHEYVHAWQWENLGNRWDRLHHGKRDYFLQWKQYLESEFGLII